MIKKMNNNLHRQIKTTLKMCKIINSLKIMINKISKFIIKIIPQKIISKMIFKSNKIIQNPRKNNVIIKLTKAKKNKVILKLIKNVKMMIKKIKMTMMIK